MSEKVPQPNFRTPDDQLSEVERAKIGSQGVRGHMIEDWKDFSRTDVLDETEILAKSHGIYLEYNRAKTGKEKDWMYMVRVSIPGGGAFTREHWRVFDELGERYTANAEGRPSLRVTTRQNIQYHWVKKPHVAQLVREIAATGFFTLNGCGDNVRNTMACPLAKFSTLYNANEMARKVATYFRLPAEPHIQVFEIDTSLIRTPDQHFDYGEKLLNRKWKMAFSAVHQDEKTGEWKQDNCVELRTNEVGVAPVIEKGKVVAFQVYIGGSQGEKNGKPTFAAHGRPFGVFTEANLLKGIDAITTVHKEWGDRQNRHWARLKYVIHAKGIPWYQDRVRELGGVFEPPIPGFDPGPRLMHHGWHKQPSNGLLAYGAYIENGRLINRPEAKLKSMVLHLMETYPIELMATPNQDLLFTNIPPAAKEDFERDLAEFGHGTHKGKPYSTLRLLSGACVGLDTCRLAYTESEQFEPELLDELEARGYGDVSESIGITGCERQCFRPATKTIGLVGQGPDLYGVKLFASEDARHQGIWLVDDDRWFLRQVPRKDVATLIATIFDWHEAKRQNGEDVGAFLRRMGPKAVVEYLKQNPDTAHLMEKTAAAPFQPAEETCGAGQEI